MLLESEDDVNLSGEENISGEESCEESDSEESYSELESEEESWSENIEQIPELPFTSLSGIDNHEILLCTSPIEFYQKFLDDELISYILEETNKYASKKYINWKILESDEFYKFIAICLHMGIERRPNIKLYWSTRKVFSESFAAKFMSRNRFIQILNGLHFADNITADKSNRLYKIQSIIEL